MVLEDAAVQIFVGDLWTGKPPVFSGPGSAIIAQVKRLEYSDEIKKTDTSGASGFVLNRYHSRERNGKMQGVVPATGTALRTPTGDSLVGYNIKIVVKPNSSLAQADTLTGVVTKWSPSASKGDNQLIDIEFDMSADWTSPAS